MGKIEDRVRLIVRDTGDKLNVNVPAVLQLIHYNAQQRRELDDAGFYSSPLLCKDGLYLAEAGAPFKYLAKKCIEFYQRQHPDSLLRQAFPAVNSDYDLLLKSHLEGRFF